MFNAARSFRPAPVAHTAIVCSLCIKPRPVAEIGHIDMGEGAIPVCVGCLAEMADVCDGRRDALIEAVEHQLGDIGALLAGESLMSEAELDMMVAGL